MKPIRHQDPADANPTPPPAIQVRARLPLDNGAEASIIGFDNLADGRDHVALVFPPPRAAGRNATPPLVRLHSECLTGDVFGSARCDCGPQLAEAKNRLSAEGGVLLYLRQEGRGIGLYHKLHAYRLQEAGMDTFAANRHLRFGEDERDFGIAAQMLHALGVPEIRLLTNNPDKAAALTRAGIRVAAILPTGRFENPENSAYLAAKRGKGHTV